jgi:hypothetical protein
MATSPTGDTDRWRLTLNSTPTGDLATWVELHVRLENLVIPQTLTCVDGFLSGLVSFDQTGMTDIQADIRGRALVEDPPVDVVCWHRWADTTPPNGTPQRSCLECDAVQAMDWVLIAP